MAATQRWLEGGGGEGGLVVLAGAAGGADAAAMRLLWMHALCAAAKAAAATAATAAPVRRGRTVVVCLERPWAQYAAAVEVPSEQCRAWEAADVAGDLESLAARGRDDGARGSTALDGAAGRLLIDTIGPLLDRFGVGPTVRLLRRWALNLGAGTVVAGVHCDLHADLAVAQLEAEADVWVAPETSAPGEGRAPRALLPAAGPGRTWTAVARWTQGTKRHREVALVTGTVAPLVFQTAPAAAAVASTATRSSASGVRTTAPAAAARPAELTFSVALTERQRDARAQVVLPYLAAQQPPPPRPAGGAGVVYHADSGDDIDEDDPDDDLDL